MMILCARRVCGGDFGELVHFHHDGTRIGGVDLGV
jgi:hypothetical protein